MQISTWPYGSVTGIEPEPGNTQIILLFSPQVDRFVSLELVQIFYYYALGQVSFL